MSAQVLTPSIIEIGKQATHKLADILALLGCNNPLIISDAMMVTLKYTDHLQEVLHSAGLPSAVFSDTVPEPTESSIIAGVNQVKNNHYDCLIALGGGSPIDSAKAISILAAYGGKMRDYKVPNRVTQKGIPVIAIPTTAGTGSEMTRFTIITDDENDEKMLCAGPGFVPSAAIVDYSLTLSLPPRITADTGIDALTHAIEAYVSKKANAYSDSQALAAMSLIAPNLREAFHNGSNEAAREAMMMGATLAGAAFSAASVALVHGMSRPIGAHFHVPHGLSNAMLLPAVTAFSIPAADSRYARCAKAMGVAHPNDSVATANDKLVDELYRLNQELQVPTPAEYGIDESTYNERLPLMAAQAIASGSPGNNPRLAGEEDIIQLYRSVWA